MASSPHKRARSRGVLSLEAAIGIVILLIVFLTCLHITRELWEQLEAEQEAIELAKVCARLPAAAGTVRQWRTEGAKHVSVQWGENTVVVRLSTRSGRTIAQKFVAREVP